MWQNVNYIFADIYNEKASYSRSIYFGKERHKTLIKLYSKKHWRVTDARHDFEYTLTLYNLAELYFVIKEYPKSVEFGTESYSNS